MVRQGVLGQAHPLGCYIPLFHKSYPDQTLSVHVNTCGNSKKNKKRENYARWTSEMDTLRRRGFDNGLPPC